MHYSQEAKNVWLSGVLFLSQALLKSLAEAELDDAMDLAEEDLPALNAVIRERGSVQLSSLQEPVTVRGWPMGLALASAPSITMSLTATGFQKMMSVLASLNVPSRRREYKVKPNQYSQELASIRAQPKVRAHSCVRCTIRFLLSRIFIMWDSTFSCLLRDL